MKRRKVWLLLLIMLFVFTACGQRQEAKGPEAVEVQGEQEKQAEEKTEPEDSDERADAAEPSGDAKEEPEAEPEGEYQKGQVTGNKWESAYFGLRYAAPKGMHMATEEELNSMMGIGEELLSDDFSRLQLKYAEMVSVYEMMSTDDTGAVNVLVTSEKVLGGLDAETYAEKVRKQLEEISVAEYVFSGQQETASVGGKDFVRFSCMADYGDVSMHQDYYIRSYGDRVAAIIVTYVDQTAELAKEALDGFTGL